MEAPRLVQLIVQPCNRGESQFHELVALGDDGRVYRWQRTEQCWVRLPNLVREWDNRS
jgi:hypothetical protein